MTQYRVATKPLYSAKQYSELMTLQEAKELFERVTSGWTAQAKSAYLRHMDNMDVIWVERAEDLRATEPKPVGIFERVQQPADTGGAPSNEDVLC